MDGITPLLIPQLFSIWECYNFSASFTMPAIYQQSFLGQIDVLFSWFCMFGVFVGFCVVYLHLKSFLLSSRPE